MHMLPLIGTASLVYWLIGVQGPLIGACWYPIGHMLPRIGTGRALAKALVGAIAIIAVTVKRIRFILRGANAWQL